MSLRFHLSPFHLVHLVLYHPFKALFLLSEFYPTKALLLTRSCVILVWALHEVKFGGVTVQIIALLTFIVTPLKKPVAKEARGEKGN